MEALVVELFLVPQDDRVDVYDVVEVFLGPSYNLVVAIDTAEMRRSLFNESLFLRLLLCELNSDAFLCLC